MIMGLSVPPDLGYNTWEKGVPMIIAPDVVARFWEKVERSDGCWLWKAACTGNGYGAFKIRGRQWAAHQVSYLLHHGQIADGLWVLHSCDTPRCVNPDHLSLGTPAQNSQERDGRGRGNKRPYDRSGEANPKLRISEDQARTIIARLAQGECGADIGRDMGIAYHIVSDIRNKRSWGYLPR